MPFIRVVGGGNINLNNVVHKAFLEDSGEMWLTTYTLETNYKYGHVVVFNDIPNGVYVSLNGVEQECESAQKGERFFLMSVLLRNLKKGDVLVVRGTGMGIFIK